VGGIAPARRKSVTALASASGGMAWGVLTLPPKGTEGLLSR
jgi:hypothetical protein